MVLARSVGRSRGVIRRFVQLALAGVIGFAVGACVGAEGAGTTGSAEGAALADFHSRAGTTCAQMESILKRPPSDADVAGRRGWTGGRGHSMWVGDIVEAAADLDGRLFVAAPGDVWISGVVDGRPAALRLVELTTPGGVRVWVVVARVTPTTCPADGG